MNSPPYLKLPPTIHDAALLLIKLQENGFIWGGNAFSDSYQDLVDSLSHFDYKYVVFYIRPNTQRKGFLICEDDVYIRGIKGTLCNSVNHFIRIAKHII
jgi:hypothetical protein